MNRESELHLLDYISIVRRRATVIILFFGVTVFVVALGSFLMRPVYRATVTLLIDVESPDVLTATGMVTLDSQSYYTYKEYYQSQKEIITSRSIAHKVFDEFELGQMREFAKAKDPIEQFLKTVKVEPVRDTRLLELQVYNKDPVLASKIANRIADLYVKRNLYYISRNELSNLLKNEYLKMEAKLSEYSKIYKEKHPKMIRLKEEMRELTDRIEQSKGSVFNLKILDEIGPEGTSARYTLKGLKANNISVQDEAETPLVPVKPKKLVNMLLAVVVGLFGGVGLGFFIEYVDDTIKFPEEIERIIKWPCLGSISVIGNSSMTELDKDLLVRSQPKEPAAEAFRTIRTSVFFSSTEDHPIKAIVITSPGPQEGKTTILCNLGIAMAQSQKKVLFVDADMRRPRLHEIFNKKKEKGLSDFLCGHMMFDDLIIKTDIDGVYLVKGGPHVPNPSELISSAKMQEFIKSAKSKFDFVLFDTPPMLVVTDAVVLSKISDGVIMVIEGGKTSRRVLPRAAKVFDEARARVIGAILNKISSKIASAYYYQYYSYYYGK